MSHIGVTGTRKILATVVRARFGLPQRVLAELFGGGNATISDAERQIRPLLDQRNHTIEPADHFKTLTELTAYTAAHRITPIPGVKSAC